MWYLCLEHNVDSKNMHYVSKNVLPLYLFGVISMNEYQLLFCNYKNTTLHRVNLRTMLIHWKIVLAHIQFDDGVLIFLYGIRQHATGNKCVVHATYSWINPYTVLFFKDIWYIVAFQILTLDIFEASLLPFEFLIRMF